MPPCRPCWPIHATKGPWLSLLSTLRKRIQVGSSTAGSGAAFPSYPASGMISRLPSVQQDEWLSQITAALSGKGLQWSAMDWQQSYAPSYMHVGFDSACIISPISIHKLLRDTHEGCCPGLRRGGQSWRLGPGTRLAYNQFQCWTCVKASNTARMIRYVIPALFRASLLSWKCMHSKAFQDLHLLSCCQALQ